MTLDAPLDDSGAGKPIFLTGTGRCGTTVTYHLLAMHPDLAWISSWVRALRGQPALAVANRIWDLTAFDRFRGRRLLPNPVEMSKVFAPLVADYDSEVVSERALEEARNALVPLVEQIRRYHGKPRFLSKYVGRPSKATLLAELYPEGYLIHVTRDFRPTVSSLMKVAQWDLRSLDNWKWDAIPEEYLDFFEQCGRSEVIGAAITVKLNRDVIDRQLESISPSQWMELRYSDLVEAPVDSLRRVAEATELRMDEAFFERVARRPVYKHADEKWRKHLTEEQVEMLDGFEELAGVW